MTTLRKPRGQPHGKILPDIVRLKELWRDPLANIDRLYWRRRFLSTATQAEIRAELFKTCGIQLRSDGRLTDFRQWLDARDAEALEDFSI